MQQRPSTRRVSSNAYIDECASNGGTDLRIGLGSYSGRGGIFEEGFEQSVLYRKSAYFSRKGLSS